MNYSFWDPVIWAFDLGILFYSVGLFSLYLMLALLAYKGIRRNRERNKLRLETILEKSPLTPGISIVAPAFNEGPTIIANVRSLLTLNYPRFEVIIVNDGSTDDTLDKLINEFKLVRHDIPYESKVPSQPIRCFFKSTSMAYSNLIVVDKVNGKSKADAVNAGINIASYPYLLNTDVDCILDRDTLLKLVQPFMEDGKRVIAVGAGLRIANSCEVDRGTMMQVKVPEGMIPRFQEVEYIRSFVLGKVGWSQMNAVPNVSGGLGLFDTDILIKAGGYDPRSFGEDMDMIVRMAKYMCDNKQDYAIRYVPQALCWTEAPDNLKVFGRQRTRWARGLFQIFAQHGKMLLHPRYKRMGLITFPYNFFFELLAPIIEFLGLITYFVLIATGQINFVHAGILLVFVYSFSVFITLLSIMYDQFAMNNYSSPRELAKLCMAAVLEPFLYHPLIIFFSLKGYFNQLFGRQHAWGNMQRKGFRQQADQPSVIIR
ncbi:glycosyltransferase family 2 protein [Flavihumibacter rivuli]|uniref:glycosyltransferase family 2 protein n=1 Tax=Flavihumibacter rivuli TaxID=2838156 RepID=UPI001BDE151C|nr:glycosyltransferase family 2 protein [Flavihumibacter rivuli]ULQ56146.1 glycosyltransferase family 2 protein [Flavihumibacter rivuli]